MKNVIILLLNKDGSLLRGCGVVLEDAACPGTDAPLRVSARPAADAFSPQPLTLPPAFEALRPANVDADLFASALSELCGVRGMEEWIGDGVLLDADTYTFALAAKRLRFFLDNPIFV